MPPADRTLTLSVMEGHYVIAKFPCDAEIPEWAMSGEFFSVTRTVEELSLVTAEANVPSELDASRGWRMLKVRGPFFFR